MAQSYASRASARHTQPWQRASRLSRKTASRFERATLYGARLRLFLQRHHTPALVGEPVFFILNRPFYPVIATPTIIGKYRIAACHTPSATGRYHAQVSIASGSGSTSTDRVMRFVDDFSTQDAAAQYALAQGIDWAHAALRMH